MPETESPSQEWRHALLVGGGAILVALPLINTVVSMSHEPAPVDGLLRVFLETLPWSVAIVGVIAIISALALRMTRGRTDTLSTILIFSTFFVLASVFGIALQVNRRLDKSEVVVREVRQTSKYITTGRSGSYQHYIVLQSWRHDEGITLYVPEGVYVKTVNGGTWRVGTHPGYLGFEWIAWMEPSGK